MKIYGATTCTYGFEKNNPKNGVVSVKPPITNQSLAQTHGKPLKIRQRIYSLTRMIADQFFLRAVNNPKPPLPLFFEKNSFHKKFTDVALGDCRNFCFGPQKVFSNWKTLLWTLNTGCIIIYKYWLDHKLVNEYSIIISVVTYASRKSSTCVQYMAHRCRRYEYQKSILWHLRVVVSSGYESRPGHRKPSKLWLTQQGV